MLPTACRIGSTPILAWPVYATQRGGDDDDDFRRTRRLSGPHRADRALPRWRGTVDGSGARPWARDASCPRRFQQGTPARTGSLVVAWCHGGAVRAGRLADRLRV